MAKLVNLTDLSANVEAVVFGKLMDGGFIDVYDGTQPKTADDQVVGQKRGVTLSFGKPAFGSPTAGVITANQIGSGIVATTLNPATWARIYRADHQTVVMDVSVGTGDAVIVLPTVNLPKGITVTCSFFEHTVTKSSKS
jgi:hypothetical protein